MLDEKTESRKGAKTQSLFANPLCVFAAWRLSPVPWLLLLVGVCLAVAPGCKKGSEGSADTRARIRVAVVPKGTTHEFWKSVHAGAVKAARELDVDVVWKGPLREDDLKEQIDVVQSFVAQGVGGI